MTHKIAILGASGYTGAEMVRLIAEHPNMEITALAANAPVPGIDSYQITLSGGRYYVSTATPGDGKYSRRPFWRAELRDDYEAVRSRREHREREYVYRSG